MATDKSENYLYEQHSGHVFSSNFPASVTHFTLSNKSNTIFNQANRQIILQLPILNPALQHPAAVFLSLTILLPFYPECDS